MARPRKPFVVLDKAARSALQTVLKFNYVYGITLRKAGYTVRGANRNTYDTGALYRSLRVFKVSPSQYQMSFTADYAEKLLEERPELLKFLSKTINYEELAAGVANELFAQKKQASRKQTGSRKKVKFVNKRKR